MQLYINARFLTQQTTGVQRFAIEISKHLKRLCSDIQFVAPGNVIHKGLAEDLEVQIVGKKSGHFWEQIELPRYLKSVGNPVLLNLCNTAPLLYKKNLVTIHDLAVFDFPQAYSFIFRKFYQHLLPRISKNALSVFTVSEFSKQRIESVFNVRANVIYNSVSDYFLPSQIVYKKKYILSVSSLDPKKNFGRLVQAYNEADLKDFQLMVIGSKNNSFKEQALQIDNPNIVFTGYVTDEKLRTLYQEASFFVYPSLYEGFGIPPLEAMASGCPTLVSDIPSLREVCGDASLYFDPNNTQSIVEKLKLISTDSTLVTDLIQKGSKNAKRFSWEGSAMKMMDSIVKITES